MSEKIQVDLEWDFREAIIGHSANRNATMIDAITVLRALGNVMAEVLSGFSEEATRGCLEDVFVASRKFRVNLELDRYGLSKLPTEGSA